MDKKIFQGICVLLFVSYISATLPDYLEKCPPGDKQCLLKNINSVFINKVGGDEQFGLRSLEPINLEDIDIREDSKNPVNINITFFNPSISGATNVRATNVKGFGKSPDGHHMVLLKAPYITMLSDYSVNGKVLILPVVGKGKCNITMINPQIKIDIEGASKVQDGQVYMDVKKIALDVLCDKVNLHFADLFNGDKALGDNVNVFINENWKEIYNEMNGPIFKRLSEPLLETIQKIFNKTPYANMIGNE